MKKGTVCPTSGDRDRPTPNVQTLSDVCRPLLRGKGHPIGWLVLLIVFLVWPGSVGGSPKAEGPAADYAPIPGLDWEVSTPAEQGLDPALVARFYQNASDLETLYGLLVIKNGYLIAEKYFNKGSIGQVSGRQSATKSYTSALVGIALEQGYLSSVDQKMVEFFPELAGQITDPRKHRITIRHLLQMRGGYPDEEEMPTYLGILFFREDWHWLPHIEGFPLVCDPGAEFHYSNLTSHLLGVIVARACGADLRSFAQQHLFSPMKAEVVDWSADADGYNWGWGEIYVTARDMAKFGLLYMRGGEYEGNRILPDQWVSDSLKPYTENIKRGGWITSRYGSFRNIGYGYQWWSATVGSHRFDYACGHGANYIILLHELDMIIVTTADPLYGPELAGAGGWKYEGAINEVVGRFIKSLPKR
jgi:CubicO group peptidase (beta-lactamase class C family)